MNWLGLDIGGANIKAADGRGYSAIEHFALWREPARLSDVLRNVVATAPVCDRVAATMTGELADCFATKEEGVRHILDALERAAAGRHAYIYRLDGRIVPLASARQTPLLAAAANWHALACFAGRLVEHETALLIDIGSTTTDIVPLINGRPLHEGQTDTERLLSGELVYTGIERTPVCAVVANLPYRDRLCPVAAELFATTWDAYLTLNESPEEPDNRNTADGRAATREAARARLARCICADAASFDARDALAAAEAIRDQQIAKIAAAVERALSRTPRIASAVVSGQGEFLARRVLEQLTISAPVVSLAERLGAQLSRCAPAHAVAVLAREGYAA